jgi:hypothetical protein
MQSVFRIRDRLKENEYLFLYTTLVKNICNNKLGGCYVQINIFCFYSSQLRLLIIKKVKFLKLKTFFLWGGT